MKSLHSLLTAIALTAATLSAVPTPTRAQPVAPAQPAAAPAAPAEMLTNGSFTNGLAHWDLEQNAKATGLAETAPDGPNNAPALRIKVLTLGDAPWQLQTYQKGLRVEKGKTYTFSFSAKSDRAGDITVNCMQNHAPWDHHTQQVIALTPEWQQIKYEFTAPWDDDNVRVGFTNLATTPGQTYWFTNCSLTPNPPAAPPAPKSAPKTAPSSALPATTPPTATAQPAAATTPPPSR